MKLCECTYDSIHPSPKNEKYYFVKYLLDSKSYDTFKFFDGHLSEEEANFFDIIRGMLHPDPEKRSKLSDIIENRFFTQLSVSLSHVSHSNFTKLITFF